MSTPPTLKGDAHTPFRGGIKSRNSQKKITDLKSPMPFCLYIPQNISFKNSREVTLNVIFVTVGSKKLAETFVKILSATPPPVRCKRAAACNHWKACFTIVLLPYDPPLYNKNTRTKIKIVVAAAQC